MKLISFKFEVDGISRTCRIEFNSTQLISIECQDTNIDYIDIAYELTTLSFLDGYKPVINLLALCHTTADRELSTSEIKAAVRLVNKIINRIEG